MTVIWQINLQHMEPDPRNELLCVESITSEYMQAVHCRPRKIQIAHNGIGHVVGEKLLQRGLPIDFISPSEWRQLVDPLDDGHANPGETCF